MGYFELLLLLHIFGAIVGFGPAYSFSILGPLQGRLGGAQALGIMKGGLNIARRLVFPVAFVVQPLTGALLIFETGRDQNFFSHEWLWIGILLYAVIFYGAAFVQRPSTARLVDLAEAGEAGTPEFASILKRSKMFGMIMTVSLTIIIFLMIAKPGSPEGFF